MNLVTVNFIKSPFSKVFAALDGVSVIMDKMEAGFNEAADRIAKDAVESRTGDFRYFFIGNGASAALASHMAADWLKAGGIQAQCFNDGALMSCLGNDLGFSAVFAKPLARHGRPSDVLVAISASGESSNVTTAAQIARGKDMQVISLTGFSRDNHLAKLGHISFHAPSFEYGTVEVAHHAILHNILDRIVAHGP